MFSLIILFLKYYLCSKLIFKFSNRNICWFRLAWVSLESIAASTRAGSSTEKVQNLLNISTKLQKSISILKTWKFNKNWNLAIDTLARDYQDIFERDPDFSIYSDDITFEVRGHGPFGNRYFLKTFFDNYFLFKFHENIFFGEDICARGWGRIGSCIQGYARWHPSSKNVNFPTTCFKNFLQNFGDESQFWWFWDFGIDFKILKKVCHVCYPILGQILENFDFRILVKSQSYDKPPWRNFDFWSNFVEIENFGF